MLRKIPAQRHAIVKSPVDGNAYPVNELLKNPSVLIPASNTNGYGLWTAALTKKTISPDIEYVSINLYAAFLLNVQKMIPQQQMNIGNEPNSENMNAMIFNAGYENCDSICKNAIINSAFQVTFFFNNLKKVIINEGVIQVLG